MTIIIVLHYLSIILLLFITVVGQSQYHVFCFFKTWTAKVICSVPLLSFMIMIINFDKEKKYQCVFIHLFIVGEAILFDLIILTSSLCAFVSDKLVMSIDCMILLCV